MSSNINSKVAQLLNQSPNFRTAGTNLRREFCSAHDDSSVIDEKTHNASQPGVSL